MIRIFTLETMTVRKESVYSHISKEEKELITRVPYRFPSESKILRWGFQQSLSTFLPSEEGDTLLRSRILVKYRNGYIITLKATDTSA